MNGASPPPADIRPPLASGADLLSRPPATLTELFEFVARVHSRPDTLNYKKDDRWQSISSTELLQRARTIAAGLHSLGIKPGDRVALLSESRAEWHW